MYVELFKEQTKVLPVIKLRYQAFYKSSNNKSCFINLKSICNKMTCVASAANSNCTLTSTQVFIRSISLKTFEIPSDEAASLLDQQSDFLYPPLSSRASILRDVSTVKTLDLLSNLVTIFCANLTCYS